MGFGILFLGYIIMSVFSLNPFGAIAQLLGYSIITYALVKLSPYAKNFKIAVYTVIPLTATSAFSSVLTVCERIGLGTSGLDGVKEILGPVVAVLVFAFHLFLLFGIREIAIFTELPKIADRAVRNFVVGVFYFALTLIGSFDIPALADFAKYFGLPTLLIGLLWFVLNIVLIYSCYMWICLEGDENMERKRSRFEIINKLNDAFDKKEEEAIKSTIEYAHSKKRKKKKK